MRLIEGLIYQYYWRDDGKLGRGGIISYFTFITLFIKCTLYNIFYSLFSASPKLSFLIVVMERIQEFEMSSLYTYFLCLFALTLLILWPFLRKEKFEAIIYNHEKYDTEFYESLANWTPLCLFFTCSISWALMLHIDGII